jgi:hypothetical protein
MALITDADGEPLGYLSYDLVAGEGSELIEVIVTAGAGRRLESTVESDVHVLAREAGSVGAFTDLATGIALDSYGEGVEVTFELKVTTEASFVGQERFAVWIGVTSDGAAGWGE